MKSILLLSALLWAASAAPAELQAAAAVEAAAESPMEDVAAVEAPAELQAAAAVEAVAESPMGNKAAVEANFNFCPQDWLSHGSRCFKFISSPMTWYNAEEHCNNLGGHLASVVNPQEYNYLQQIVQLTGQTNVWLGGFVLQGRWMWIDRQGFYYNNWSTQSSSTTYPCIYLRSTTGWSNTQCTSSLRFICSKNPFGC
ncbi:galactose-specific lectin nattectin-like isoform X1 [Gouania willdenowi]|uniref:Ladderlectin-like n=1 Tax=Gouania willdenowi TaxID=441366 RepID=A0A8C5D4C8_GOUWI|nr:galactose-specific lectin nattectin-like isoform X1 [Gouania willdenowi]